MTPRELLARLMGLLGRGRRDADLSSEMAFHLEMLTERYTNAGFPFADAQRRALAEFGGTERFKDAAREA